MRTPSRGCSPALTAALALLVVLGTLARERPAGAPQVEGPPPMAIPAPSPDLAAVRVRTLGGREASLAELTGGRPALLVFWSTWCPDCRKETPALKALWARYRVRGLRIVAVSTGGRDTVEGVRRYLDQNAITYPVYYDADKSASKAFGIAWIPTFFLVNGKGQVVYKAATLPGDPALKAILAGHPLPQ